MRNPLGDGADQRRSRRRGKNADPSDRGDSGPTGAGRTGGRSDRGRTSHDSDERRHEHGGPRTTDGAADTKRPIAAWPAGWATWPAACPRPGCSNPVMAQARLSRLTATEPEAGRAARAPGTARRLVAPPAGARSAAIRQFRASRRRCTRRASSPPGTEGQAGPPCSQGRTGQAPGLQDCRETAAGQLRTAARRPEVPPAIRGSRRRPGRQAPRTASRLSRGTTLRISAPVPSPVTRCWPSAIRQRT